MSTFWRYVRIQLAVFVCGIVGPIFLITYFAIQPEPDTKWMYWWGLFITAFDVLLALVLTRGAGTAEAKDKPTTAELIEAASAKLRTKRGSAASD
jgi:hypothetical protein